MVKVDHNKIKKLKALQKSQKLHEVGSAEFAIIQKRIESINDSKGEHGLNGIYTKARRT